MSVAIRLCVQYIILTAVLLLHLGLHLGKSAERVVLENALLLLLKSVNVFNHLDGHVLCFLNGLRELLKFRA